jgi:hypothetical protein
MDRASSRKESPLPPLVPDGVSAGLEVGRKEAAGLYVIRRMRIREGQVSGAAILGQAPDACAAPR